MRATIFSLFFFTLLLSTPALAADVYYYEASKGLVTFDHKAHQMRIQGDCTRCHTGTPAKIALTKKYAHKGLCKKVPQEQ